MLFAQAVSDIQMSDTIKTEFGLIGLITIGITVLTFVILVKKVFGRSPPLDTEFKKLRSELYEVSNRVKKEVGKDTLELSNRVNEVENEIDEIKLDRERKWNELRNEYHKLDRTMATLQGRIEEVLKKIK